MTATHEAGKTPKQPLPGMREIVLSVGIGYLGTWLTGTVPMVAPHR